MIKNLLKIISRRFYGINSFGWAKFYANWCGPCKVLSPIIEKLSEQMEEVKFIKVDVDKHDELARKYGIMSIPTLIFLKNGNIVNKHIGLINEEKIIDIIDEIV